jgi:hypothetical protein
VIKTKLIFSTWYETPTEGSKETTMMMLKWKKHNVFYANNKVKFNTRLNRQKCVDSAHESVASHRKSVAFHT